MNAVEIVRQAIKDAGEAGRLVAVEVELSYQNGSLKHAKDSVSDEVPVSLTQLSNGKAAEIEDRVSRVAALAVEGKMFGIVRIQFAVLGERLSGCRCYRERNHKPA